MNDAQTNITPALPFQRPLPPGLNAIVSVSRVFVLIAAGLYAFRALEFLLNHWSGLVHLEVAGLKALAKLIESWNH
jgi:hypothetical protein